MPNTFCNLLSNGYSFSKDKNSNLTVSPCCLHTKKIIVDKNLVQQHRSNFGNITDWTDSCAHCHVLEKSGQQSLRQTGPDWIPAGVENQSAVMIDINLDTECNAACVICGEHSSSLWKSENKKFHKIKEKTNKSTQLVDDYIDLIVDTTPLDDVRYIKFFGGEPLFTDTHIKFLEKIKNPGNVTVHYTTNGSIFPKNQVQQVWNRFKTVIFAVSIDGIDKQFDYVRWPLTWTKVSGNLIQLKERNIHNLMFRVEFTANLLNTYYYDKLEQWVSLNLSANNFGDKTEISVHHCFNSAFALESMPLAVMDLIKEKYGPQHVIYELVKNSKKTQKIDEFWNFVNRWDPWRKKAWQECFPDLVPYIPNY